MEILKILLKLKSSINLNEYLFFKRKKNNKWISNKDYDVVYLQNEEDVDLSITAIKKDIPYILLYKYKSKGDISWFNEEDYYLLNEEQELFTKVYDLGMKLSYDITKKPWMQKKIAISSNNRKAIQKRLLILQTVFDRGWDSLKDEVLNYVEFLNEEQNNVEIFYDDVTLEKKNEFPKSIDEDENEKIETRKEKFYIRKHNFDSDIVYEVQAFVELWQKYVEIKKRNYRIKSKKNAFTYFINQYYKEGQDVNEVMLKVVRIFKAKEKYEDFEEGKNRVNYDNKDLSLS